MIEVRPRRPKGRFSWIPWRIVILVLFVGVVAFIGARYIPVKQHNADADYRQQIEARHVQTLLSGVDGVHYQCDDSQHNQHAMRYDQLVPCFNHVFVAELKDGQADLVNKPTWLKLRIDKGDGEQITISYDTSHPHYIPFRLYRHTPHRTVTNGGWSALGNGDSFDARNTDQIAMAATLPLQPQLFPQEGSLMNELSKVGNLPS